MQPAIRTPFRKRSAGIVSILTIVVVTTGLSDAAAASASLTVKVTDGGTYSATASQVFLIDHNVAAVSCGTAGTTPAAKSKGALNDGTHTGVSPVNFGEVSTWAFGRCDSAVGEGAVTIAVRSLPYSVAADSTTNKAGDTDLIIPGISIRVSQVGCSFTVSGSAQGYYVNGTHELHLTSSLPITPLNKVQLTMSKISGSLCPWKDGDRITMKSTYALNISVKISST
jgi:hypothetical protein